MGSYQATQAGTACKSCEPGFWCTAEEAVPCGKDTFQPLPNQSRQTACIPCSQLDRNSITNQLQAQTSASACICKGDYYNHDVNGRIDCRVCPSGSGEPFCCVPI